MLFGSGITISRTSPQTLIAVFCIQMSIKSYVEPNCGNPWENSESPGNCRPVFPGGNSTPIHYAHVTKYCVAMLLPGYDREYNQLYSIFAVWKNTAFTETQQFPLIPSQFIDNLQPSRRRKQEISATPSGDSSIVPSKFYSKYLD